MDLQEVFDTIITGIRAQGGPAVRVNGSCSYKLENGRQCAVGLLLGPDVPESVVRDNSPIMEHKEALGILALKGIHTRLLGTLQSIHDWAAAPELRVCSDAEFFAAWEPRMREFANEHELKYTVTP